jgi:hypothetical protein
MSLFALEICKPRPLRPSWLGSIIPVEGLFAPLVCRVELNLDQLAVLLMHSDFLGIETLMSALKQIEGEQVQWSSEEGIIFGIVVTSATHEECVRKQPLQGDELLIMSEKPAIRDLHDATLEQVLSQELETTVVAQKSN